MKSANIESVVNNVNEKHDWRDKYEQGKLTKKFQVQKAFTRKWNQNETRSCENQLHSIHVLAQAEWQWFFILN